MGTKKLFDSIEEFGIWVNTVGIRTFCYWESERNRHNSLASDKPFDGLLVRVDDFSVINADIAIKELVDRVTRLNLRPRTIEVYSSDAFPEYSIRLYLMGNEYWEELPMSSADNSILTEIATAKTLESVMDGSYYK